MHSSERTDSYTDAAAHAVCSECAAMADVLSGCVTRDSTSTTYSSGENFTNLTKEIINRLEGERKQTGT